MKVIFTVLVVVLITHYDRLVSGNESSEEDNPFKDLKECEGGYCVAAYLCKNGTINDGGEDILEIRVDQDDDPCEEFLQRCCAVRDAVRSQPTASPEPTDSDDLDVDLPPPSCGANRPGGYVYRVKSDSIAQFGEFPWMAVLMERRMLLDKEALQYLCGGSLIHPQVVLTAAHCVQHLIDTLDKLTVRLGEWDTVTVNEPLKHEQMGVRKIIQHEKFHDKKYHNDLALLILEKPANLNVHINLICLPKPEENFDKQRCLVSGWGRENFNPDGKYSEVLKKIKLPVVPRGECRRMLRATKLGPFFNLDKSFMCAGGEAGVDTCNGDGGSPLACKRDDVYVQSGIVAWGIGCGGADIPGVYVHVSRYVDWIRDKLRGEGMELPGQD